MSAKRRATGAAIDAAAKKTKTQSITSFFAKTASTTIPSSASSSSPSTAATSISSTTATSVIEPATWDKEAWEAKLTDEQKELLKLELEYLHPSWLRELKEHICSKEFMELKKFLQKEEEQGKTVYPPGKDIYSWSRLTPLPKVRIVILGQDPYHNVNQAHGLAFSVQPPTLPPPSLKNMFVGLKRDYPLDGTYAPGEPGAFHPPPNNLGSLIPWAERGVLLLNACLTVRAHEANSHKGKGWEKFTQKVIDVVNKKGGNLLPGSNGTGGVVFLAWGTPAHDRVKSVNSSKHLVLKAVHPSPLSAHRGFFDARHFIKANDWLKKKYGVAGMVDWDLSKKKVEVEEEKVQEKKEEEEEEAL